MRRTASPPAILDALEPLRTHCCNFETHSIYCSYFATQPDEFAQDSISPAILEALAEDAALPQMHLRSPAADLNAGYVPPPDGLLLRGAEGGQEPGLEYDGDSEDELGEMTRVGERRPYVVLIVYHNNSRAGP